MLKKKNIFFLKDGLYDCLMLLPCFQTILTVVIGATPYGTREMRPIQL